MNEPPPQPDDARRDDRGFVQALVGDGRPLLSVSGLALILSGGFALFLAATGNFLPHDERFLGMTAEQLCSLHGCRIVHFMYHDRGAFGGSIIAIGALYLWLAEFPLRHGEPWAWWTLLVSGVVGFGSFLTYVGYGYLDTWHGVATLALLPCFAGGLVRSYRTLRRPRHIRALLRPGVRDVPWTSAAGVGRAMLLVTAATIVAGGLVIMTVGMTSVFVPQDLEFMGLRPDDLRAISPRLIPLIAHDRAGFGGGLCSTGVTVFFCVWCARPGRALWQVLCFSGAAGFGTAIGVHPAVGYVDFVHLAPAVAAAVVFAVALALLYRPMCGGDGTGPGNGRSSEAAAASRPSDSPSRAEGATA